MGNVRLFVDDPSVVALTSPFCGKDVHLFRSEIKDMKPAAIWLNTQVGFLIIFS